MPCKQRVIGPAFLMRQMSRRGIRVERSAGAIGSAQPWCLRDGRISRFCGHPSERRHDAMALRRSIPLGGIMKKPKCGKAIRPLPQHSRWGSRRYTADSFPDGSRTPDDWRLSRPDFLTKFRGYGKSFSYAYGDHQDVGLVRCQGGMPKISM